MKQSVIFDRTEDLFEQWTINVVIFHLLHQSLTIVNGQTAKPDNPTTGKRECTVILNRIFILLVLQQRLCCVCICIYDHFRTKILSLFLHHRQRQEGNFLFLSRQKRHVKFGIFTAVSIVLAFFRCLTLCSLKQRGSRPTKVSKETPLSPSIQSSALQNFTSVGTFSRVKYRIIRNDCRGFNNLSYTIHLRQEFMCFFI